ncbi:membrane bound O-acyl transferase family-domain-containing protein [Hypoxylon cercidicola]|nr:membrane bound O-acyl transferase family-domain-containing protein [Hypoxylon cercidicola]
MLGQLLNPFYPPPSEREPLPALYSPVTYATVLLGYFLGPGTLQTLVITSILVPLALQRPRYTTGDVVTDYSLSGTVIILLLTYLDHGTASKNGPRFLGDPDNPLPNGGVGERDPKTWRQKLKWAFRLTTTPRGIGWNWQVKGVPAHPGARQSRSRFVFERVVEVARRSALKALAVYGIGFCTTVRSSVSTSPVDEFLLDAFVSWCGAVWSFNTIGVAHAAGGAVTVLLGICEPWEWPPVFGALGEAWSVRQLWSTSYHQILRRPLQQPGIRIARFLGLEKGTFASRYMQLYLAFFISFGTHWWQSYTVTRQDNGEFAFFMLQPVIITIEDFLQWIWGKSVDAERRKQLAWLEYLVGYAWTIAAFTLTLRPVMQGWTGIGLIGSGGPDEKAALQLGRQHGVVYLRG